MKEILLKYWEQYINTKVGNKGQIKLLWQNYLTIENFYNEMVIKSLPGGMGRWQTPAWTSFRSQRRDAPWAGRWSQSRCHHRRSGRWGSPGDQCTDRTVSWCGQGPGRRSPYRWCSDHGRSCWRHPPYQWSAARGGTAGGRCQYGPHLWREIEWLDL